MENTKMKNIILIIIGAISSLALIIFSVFNIVSINKKQSVAEKDYSGISILSNVQERGVRLASGNQTTTDTSTIIINATVGPDLTLDKSVSLSVEWESQRSIPFVLKGVNANNYQTFPYSAMFQNIGCTITAYNESALISGEGLNKYLVFTCPAGVSIDFHVFGGASSYENSKTADINYFLDDGTQSINVKSESNYVYTNKTGSNLALKLIPNSSYPLYLASATYRYNGYTADNNVNNYIQATPYDKGTYSECAIVRKKAFSAPIKLIVTSNSNPNLKAYATIDFVGRSISTSDTADLSSLNINTCTAAEFRNKFLTLNYHTIGGTIMGTIKNLEVSPMDDWELIRYNDKTCLSSATTTETMRNIFNSCATNMGVGLTSFYQQLVNKSCVGAYFGYDVYYGDSKLTSTSSIVSVDVVWGNYTASSLEIDTDSLIY